jgi:hypothetical protein
MAGPISMKAPAAARTNGAQPWDSKPPIIARPPSVKIRL